MVVIIMKIGFITWTTGSDDGVVFTLMFTFVCCDQRLVDDDI